MFAADQIDSVGEKRKQKLQYLQHLLEDNLTETESGTSEGSELAALPRRPMSLSPMPMSDLNSFSPTTGNAFTSISAPISPYHSPFLTPSTPYAGIEPSWNAPAYTAAPQQQIPTWNAPQWGTRLAFPTQMTAPESVNYTYAPLPLSPPPPPQPSFEGVLLPARVQPHFGHRSDPSAEFAFPYTAPMRSIGQSQDTSSVSLQSSSPHTQAQYYRAP